MTAAEREALAEIGATGRIVRATVADDAATYGPTWATSSLLAECRRRLASAEGHTLDGDAPAAAIAAKDAAAVALALAIRLAARVPA